MSFTDRIDPELLAGLDAFPPDLLDLTDIPRTRAKFNEWIVGLPSAVVEGVRREEHRVPGPSDGPPVSVLLYRPEGQAGALPAVLWIHGGGYVLGQAADDDSLVRGLALNVKCVVASVDYRLAPEHPFPAPLEDCYAALKWLWVNAARLSVNPSRIAIAGASAGGGLTAALALLARDRGEVPVRFQVPIYPMIDDRGITFSSRAITEPRVWNARVNLLGWKAYLGQEPGGEGVSPYAAAARAAKLTGLPPAFIPVGDLDLFLDENVEYAQRLARAGVPTELHVYAGAFHGFYLMVPEADVSRRFIRDYEHALRRALHG